MFEKSLQSFLGGGPEGDVVLWYIGEKFRPSVRPYVRPSLAQAQAPWRLAGASPRLAGASLRLAWASEAGSGL